MENKRKKRRAKADSQTVYTPPKAFNRRRLGIQLATVAAVVLALIFGLSIFFKVDKVQVSNKGTEQEPVSSVEITGNTLYTADQIVDASGVKKGDSLFGLSKSAIASRIMQKLPYIGSVRVGIGLPGTVSIEVEEIQITYAIAAQDETWWLMGANGKLVEKINAGDAKAHTNVLGVTLDNPELAAQAVAFQPEPGTDAEGQPIPVTTYASQRLETALEILRQLEKQGILGQAASVDVTEMSSLVVWYKDQFEITLGDSTRLDYKLSMVKGAIEQIGEYRTGNMDVSFTIRPDEVIFTPFE